MTLDREDIQAIAETMAPMVARMLSAAMGFSVVQSAGAARPVDRLIDLAKVDREASIKAARELFKQQNKRRASHA